MPERCVKPNVENLGFFWIGEEFVAEADFLGKHISVRCRYDTYQRCWRSDVFLAEESGPRRLALQPSDLYASTKTGAVHRGMRLAKYAVMGIERPVAAPSEDRAASASPEEEVDAARTRLFLMHWLQMLARASRGVLRRG